MTVPRVAALSLVLAGCLQSPPSAGEPPPVDDATARPDATPCPAADDCFIDQATGHTYAAWAEHLTWNAARLACEDAGWYLASDLGELESLIIEGLLGEPMWIGARDEVVDGDWRWLTGEPFDYTHWYGGEPNGEASANCLLASWLDEGWNDEDCDTVWAYVCEAGGLQP